MFKIAFLEDWPEIIGFILLVIGAFVGIFATSAIIAYTLILLVGMMGGRMWYRIKLNFKVAWSITLIGFLIGFMVGNKLRLGGGYGDSRIIILFYVAGIVLSYYLHDKGIIKSIEY